MSVVCRRSFGLSGLALLLLASGGLRADPETDKLKSRVAELETEVTLLKQRLAKLETREAAPTPRPLKITVLPGDWGTGGMNDIAAVCRSAAAELANHFPNRDWDPVTIRHDPKQGPMVIYGKGADGERRVLLNARDTYWAQFSYQFAHEMCHILCNYRDGNKANHWFEESLCETASLYSLRRMAETWKTKPPYSNWKSYAEKLGEYAAKRIEQTDKLEGLTLGQWYQRNEAELRKNATNRPKNQVVAIALLPLFEKQPDGWRAVGFLNQSDPKKELTFDEYLRDWQQRCPVELKGFVGEIIKQFAVEP